MDALHRTFTAEMTPDDDKRTVYGRIVPYNEVATVGPDPWHPQGQYKEMFRFGVMKKLTRAADRVFLAFEHESGVLAQLGQAQEIEEREDGAYGSFRVLRGVVGDHALEMVKSKMLRAFSVGFWPLGTPQQLSDGTYVRTRIRLDEVSLCREAAYAGAEVAGVRSAQLHDARAEAENHARESAPLDERLRALGYLA